MIPFLDLKVQYENIQTAIHYPIPVHLQEAYSEYGYGAGDLPVTEQAVRKLLSLPVFPELQESQIEEVCRAVHEVTQ